MIASKNSIYNFILVSFLAIILPLNLFAQEKKPTRVLFVGNSFTYFWNMPQLVKAMGASQGVSLEIHQSTVGGSNLKQHWLEEKGTLTRKFLKEERWDYVILGDHSLSTIDTPESFKIYAKKFSKLVRSGGAEPIFYMTWAYKSNPLMQPAITQGYTELAAELDASIIPVGPIWMQARELRPDLNMYFDDKHPSTDGSYLIALIVYKTLTGNAINEISNRVTTTDIDGEKLYLSFVLEENALFFKQLVTAAGIEPIKL
ncbi:hypothetical protein PI23P_01977 [Polaribacter irgensii 23-P]|uniref:SGNH hydrolase-type esterase domain-containing protein n=1 Tax=Polaribacter irgensii 23-P TaxID=313594 RepID=A4BW82_9FLAO|nr:hypothetical protein [Polaribacter irgensii]EAR13223.1 hypothetical protein PI23P_01977 [Polaribacter irgensii 23-P]